MYKGFIDYLSTPVMGINKEKKIVYANNSLCRLMNLRSLELLGKPVQEIFPCLGDDDFNFGNSYRRRYWAKEIVVAQKKMIANFVSTFDHDVSVMIFIELHREEMDSIEGGLIKANELQAIIDASYDGIYITNRFGNTIFVNKSYEKITGIKREELLGKNIAELEQLGMFSPIVTPTILKEKIPITCSQTLRNGKKVIITGNPVFDGDGEVAYVITNVRDITEIIDLRLAIKKQKELNYEFMQRLNQIEEEKKLEESFIAKSSSMQAVLNIAAKVAKVDTTVLIIGETGVGKEEVAKYIYKMSDRSSQPIITVNCGAIAPTLLESELFGYEKGAFTGALNRDKKGLFESADKGTIFLDEIGDMPLDLQIKLLRVIQNGEIKRVGSTKPIKVDVRLICATNKNLEKLVAQGKFREDLYYRLNVVTIEIPPLRERKEDIPHLAHHFCYYFNKKYRMKKRLTTELIDVLLDYHWPGNVRELKNVIEQLVILSCDDEIKIQNLPREILKAKQNTAINSVVYPHKKITIIQDNHNINLNGDKQNTSLSGKWHHYIDCDEHDTPTIERTLFSLFNESVFSKENTIIFLHRISQKILDIFANNYSIYQKSNCVLVCSATANTIHQLYSNSKYRSLWDLVTVIDLPANMIITNKSNSTEELINYYFEYYCHKYKIDCSISPEAKMCLLSHKWKDEEEIKSLMEQLVLGGVTNIETYHLPKGIYANSFLSKQNVQVNWIMPIKDAVEQVEKQLIKMAIKKHGSKRKAAFELGVDPSTIGRKIDRYKIM